jgi:integrase
MRGTVRQRKSGRWAYGLTLPGRDPATGKRRQITKGGFRTRKECQAELNKVLDQINERTYARPTRLTVVAYLEDWLAGCEVRPTTLARYRSIVNAHLVPGLGHLKLVELAPADLKRLYAALRDRGAATKTITHVHSVIHKALQDAWDLDLLSRNVADRVRPPKAKTAKQLGEDLACWSPAQLRAFLTHVRQDRLYPAWRLAAQSGMRRGELVGLRWSDVDLEAGTVRVAATRVMVGYTVQVSDPKTEKGRRTFALDPETAAALRAWRLTQAQERLRVGPGYEDSGYCFTNPDGSPIHPQRFSDWFQQHCRRAGLPRIRLHDVRHSYATAGLAAGVPLKVMSARLGHANTAITADLYQHVLPAMDEAAALQVAAVIDG